VGLVDEAVGVPRPVGDAWPADALGTGYLSHKPPGDLVSVCLVEDEGPPQIVSRSWRERLEEVSQIVVGHDEKLRRRPGDAPGKVDIFTSSQELGGLLRVRRVGHRRASVAPQH
jgi:hypothetical protein